MRRSHVAVGGRFERANFRVEVLPGTVSDLMIPDKAGRAIGMRSFGDYAAIGRANYSSGVSFHRLPWS